MKMVIEKPTSGGITTSSLVWDHPEPTERFWTSNASLTDALGPTQNLWEVGSGFYWRCQSIFGIVSQQNQVTAQECFEGFGLGRPVESTPDLQQNFCGSGWMV